MESENEQTATSVTYRRIDHLGQRMMFPNTGETGKVPLLNDGHPGEHSIRDDRVSLFGSSSASSGRFEFVGKNEG